MIRLFSFLRKFSITLILAIALFLTGCQNLIETPNTGVTKVTLWQGVNPPPNRDVLQKLVDKFNQQHPDIKVESLYVGQAEQQLPKILAAVVGNAPPDLLWFNATLTGQLVELNAILPLENWLQKVLTKYVFGTPLTQIRLDRFG